MTPEPLPSEVPPWPVFVRPVVQILDQTSTLRRSELQARAADQVPMSQAARQSTINSGANRAENRAGWAVTNASKAGWIETVTRGVYRITDAGRSWLTSHPEGLSTYKHAHQAFAEFWPKASPEAGDAAAEASDTASSSESPEELIATGVADLNSAVGHELLTRLRASDPTFFEKAVLHLLLSMGYGGAEQRGKHIGGTADGGVDGVIDQDALGLDQVYIQAKRYAEGNTVSRDAIQAFVGALHGQKASHGVFITTSSFTKHALEYAAGVPTRVILIDGDRLVKLMLKYKVGVQVEQSYEVIKLDEDFFE